MVALHKIRVFTDRYPLLGPAIWGLTVQYVIAQIVVALAWKQPTYSWRFNTISDLGNTVCAAYDGRFVCSPLHDLMNVSFIVLGLLMAAGSLLIYPEFRKNRGTLVGFSMMALAGFGTMLVGLAPENVFATLHFVGALLPLFIGNVSLILLGFALPKISTAMRIYSILSGVISLMALAFFIAKQSGWLGIGGVERVAAYPQTLWLIVFGIYMSADHVRRAWQFRNLRRTAKP